MKKKRIAELDALRGIAILAIILYHYTARYHQLFGPFPSFGFRFSLGYMGVQLFFIISGFSIFLGHKKTKNKLNFILKRLRKLYPSYWIAITLIFITTTIFHLPGRQISFHNFLINFTMVQRWWHIPDVDGVLWFLPVILLFYFLFFLITIINQENKIEFYSVILMIISLTLWFKHSSYQSNWSMLFVSFKYIHLFIAGILFYKLKTTQTKLLPGVLLLTTLIPQLIIFKPLESIIVVCFYLTMILLITNRLRWLNNKILVFTGLISYQLYLIHDNIGYVIIRQLSKLKINNWLVLLTPIIVSFILARIIFFFVTLLYSLKLPLHQD